jgi:hypothetical protein
MAEKLKFRCAPRRLLVLEHHDGDRVVAAGEGCRAAIGNCVQRKANARDKLTVRVDQQLYRIDHDEDIEVIPDEE